MASFQAIVARKGQALDRLIAARNKLKKLTGVEYTDTPVTNRDQELARVQEMENTAVFLDALADNIEQRAKAKAKAAAKPKAD